MKIALSLLALPAVFGLKAGKAVRKLNDYQYQQEQEQDVEFAYLMGYESVYMTCDGSKVVQPADGGDAEYGAVVMRLCPKDSTCASGAAKCSSGYGDYVIGIQTYMQAFLDQFQQAQEQAAQYQQNNYDNQNDFDFGQFGDCQKYDIEQNQYQNQYDNGEEQEEIEYYTGPLCEDGDIKIGLFTDEYCSVKSEVSFEELTGVALPWADGIIDDADCVAYMCYGADENGNYDYNDFCTDVIDQASLKCEENMETVGQYGAQVAGCDTIAAMLPRGANGGNAGLVIIILIIVAVVGAGAWYFMQKKKSAASQEGLMM